MNANRIMCKNKISKIVLMCDNNLEDLKCIQIKCEKYQINKYFKERKILKQNINRSHEMCYRLKLAHAEEHNN